MTTKARRTKLMRDAGPYSVESCANGELRIYPDWPQEKPYRPGLLTRMALAADIELFLNGGECHHSRDYSAKKPRKAK